MENRAWHFIIHPNDCWSWQRLNEDGSLDRMSAVTGDFGKLMSDALSHGFQPDRDRWVVWDRMWRTYYAPGVEPILVPRTNPHAQVTACDLAMHQEPAGARPQASRPLGEQH